MKISNVVIPFFLMTLPTGASAAVAECEALQDKVAEVAASVLKSEYMYDCCDDTVAECMKDGNPCRKDAERLARHVCRMAASGADRAALVRSLEKRAMSVAGPVTKGVVEVNSATQAGYLVGAPDAPVVITTYTCARCPFCSKLIPALYEEMTGGRLKGRARFVLRPFPIKSHPNSGEANQALTAAAAVGSGWAFLLEAYRRFDSFSVDAIVEMAVSAGLDSARFQQEYKSDSARNALIEAKKEGLKYGVDSTPTLFINGRRYQSELDEETVVDIVMEILDQ